MAAIQEVNIPEQEENDPSSEAEKKIEPSQKLEDQAVSQQEEMEKLRRQIQEAKVAMDQQREAAKVLHIQVQKQKQRIKNRQVKVCYLRSERKKQKEEKEAALSQLSKSEEDNKELKATISSLNRKGGNLRRILRVRRGETESQTRNLGKAKDEIAVLRKEGAELYNTVTNLQNQVISLNIEKRNLEDANEKLRATEIIEFMTSEMSLMTAGHEEQKKALLSKISGWKVCVEKAEKKLEETKYDNKHVAAWLKNNKVTTGKMIKAHMETKVEIKDKIETLEKENEKLRSELNNGFVGRYRQMKRLFLRVADTLLFRIIY